MISKICAKCAEYKQTTQFHKNKNKVDGLSCTCVDCANKNSKEWYKNNKSRDKDGKLKKAYGLSLEQYNKMFVLQNGCCATCGQHQSLQSKALSVDHCHVTGAIRGLLCTGCNRGIGYFNDKIEKLEKAIEYLTATKGNS